MEVDDGTEAMQPAHILVVEDDPDTGELLRALLIENGYTASVADGGSEALRLLEAEHPDLVLMDLLLPEMDGYEVTQRIRARADGDLPIIVLTAVTETSSRLRGFDVGADDFVIKPFLPPELLARISVQLRWNRAVRQLSDQAAFLKQALDSVTRRQHQVETGFELERRMRSELLRSVNTHLQSLCTVFDAEFRRQPPGPGREALQRVIPRLRGAALVYQIAERLSDETTDFAEILRTIASSLKTVYSPRKRIPISVDAAPVNVASTLASPLSMIATELITNAFRHAFPASRFGSISVRCRV